MKFFFWIEMLVWSVGIKFGYLVEFCYRIKLEFLDFEIRKYFFIVKFVNGKLILKDFVEVFGGKFNLGVFMVNVCNFCDDVVGEMVDIILGDVWFL